MRALLRSGLWLLLLAGCTRATILPPAGRPGGDEPRGADPGDGAAVPGDQPVGDPVAPCEDGFHRCGSSCVDDLSPATCGDRCTPCPVPQNGAATCDGLACGISCDGTFLPCLGACIPAAEGPCGVNLPANEWQPLTSDDTGTRASAAMLYLAATGEYVLVGGSMTWSGGARPYDIQGMRLDELVWKNHFPFDKIGLWGPEVGISTAPLPADERFQTQDSEGVVRPSWAVYPGIPSYDQYAASPTGQKLVFYLWNRTFIYDAVARTWSFPAPATDPAGGPSAPRLLWGAMAYDSGADRALLFGGGNVLDDDGQPGTWLYDLTANTWREVAGVMPGPRALAPMVTDPGRRRALLFGGDELDRLLADTWSFDFATETWSELTPAHAPPPRAGHHLVFLPTSGRIVLLGGYDYSSTTDYVASHYRQRAWELWRFDWDTPDWQAIKVFAGGETQPTISHGGNVTYAAAAGPGDVLVIHYKNGYPTDQTGRTWAMRIDPSVTDSGATTALAVAAGATTARTGAYDPAWYTTGWPAPDPTGFAESLAALADNTWHEVDVPNRPAHNHDWGTAAIDTARQVIFRYSGGHSAHSGTDVLEYSYADNRFSLSYAPEIPIDFEYTNDQVPGQWSFDHNPFMAPHTYKIYTFAPGLDRMVMHKNGGTYFYDPATHDFELDTPLQDLGGSQYDTILCAATGGVWAWTPDGLWSLDGARHWNELTLSGASLPSIRVDWSTMVYDAAGSRLLLFTGQGTPGQVHAVTPAGAVTQLNPTGMAAVDSAADRFMREAVLLPSAGLVVFGTEVDLGDSQDRSLVYALGENRWYGYDFDGNGLQQAFYDVSLGLTVAADERIWAINTDSRIFTLTLDVGTADRTAL